MAAKVDPRERQKDAITRLADWTRRGYTGAVELPEVIRATYERDVQAAQEDDDLKEQPIPSIEEWVVDLLRAFPEEA